MTNEWPLDLRAGAREAIAPGSPRHLMLLGTTRPIAVGDKVTIRFGLADGRSAIGVFTAVADSAAGWAARQGERDN